MLSRSFTKTELQLNQLERIEVPPRIDRAVLHKTIQLSMYITELNRKKSYIIPVDYGRDQFFIRINDGGNDINAEPLDSFYI